MFFVTYVLLLCFLPFTVNKVYHYTLWSVCTDQINEHSLTAPPSSTEAACTATSTATARQSETSGGGVMLSRHLAFLAGVMSLDSVAAAAGLHAAPASATHVVASTVELVLDAVLRRLERYDDDNDDVMSHSTAVYAVDTVARVSDVTDVELCDVVERFVRDVVSNVVNNQRLNQVQIQNSP